MSRLALAAALAGALVLAGCLASSPSGAAPAAQQSAQAGTVAQSAPTLAAAPAADASAPRAVPLSFQGKIPRYAEPCATLVVVGDCVDLPPGTDFSTLRVAPDLPGRALSGAVTATWTSAGPTEDKLVLEAYSYGDKGGFTSFGWVYGASPLKLDFRSLDVPQDQTFYVSLVAPTQGTPGMPVPAGAWAGSNPLEQPFALQGSFLVVK